MLEICDLATRTPARLCTAEQGHAASELGSLRGGESVVLSQHGGKPALLLLAAASQGSQLRARTVLIELPSLLFCSTLAQCFIVR